MIHTRGVESSSLPLAIISGNPYKNGLPFLLFIGYFVQKMGVC